MSDPAARLYVTDALAAGGSAALTPGQVHYLRHVLRLGAGARIEVFNGRDGAWAAEPAFSGKGRAEARLLERTCAQRVVPDLWLLFGPVKSARLDMAVEKATELGVAVLQPVLTEYTQCRRVNLARMQARAVEAAEQSGRLSVPEVREPVSLAALLAAWPAGRRLWHCDETGGGAPALAAFREAEPGAGDAILIGPEGGFSPREVDLLRAAPFSYPVGLGPRILRAETAAIAALALWQAVLGDGR